MSLLNLLRRSAPEPEEFPTTRLVEDLLVRAWEAGASDLHVEPGLPCPLARMRVDGEFRELAKLREDELPRVVARLKVLAGLPAFRTAEPLDGRVQWTRDGVERDLRLATLPVVGGEKAVVRFFDRSGLPRTLSDLGLGDEVLAALERLLDEPSGVIVVTGPCSSGKTTLLYALLRRLLQRGAGCLAAVSAEDPVEQRLQGVTQVEVDAARGLGFARVLAALLRQDPDVLLVGETRDPETAAMAVEAGFTGHRVLTSLHVGRLEDATRRLALLGVPEFARHEALVGGVGVRLLRRACASCGGRGCEACGLAGHRGRLAVAEAAHLARGRVERLTPSLREQGQDLVDAGLTTAAEVDRVLPRGLHAVENE